MAKYTVAPLVEVEDRGIEDRTFYAVDPAKVYPKTIAEIKRVLEQEELPPRYIQSGGEIRDNPLLRLFRMAKEVPVQAWDHALEPGDTYPPKAREQRRKALELARLWFTEVLHQETDYAPMGVHVLKDERYRL